MDIEAIKAAVDRMTAQVAGVLHFDEQRHRYTDRLGRIHSVTQTLKHSGHCRRQFRAGDAHKGTLAHKAIELHLRGDLIEETLDAALLPHVHGFKQWFKATKPEIIGSELKLYHPGLRRAGTLDFLGVIADELWLIDYKTGSPVGWHSLQTAGYKLLLAHWGIKVDKRASLYLPFEGSPHLKPHGNPRDESDFYAACATVNRIELDYGQNIFEEEEANA